MEGEQKRQNMGVLNDIFVRVLPKGAHTTIPDNATTTTLLV